MGIAIMELLSLFLLFSPAAPVGVPAPAATVFRHLPEDAVLAVGMDVASFLQGTNQELDRIMSASFLKDSTVFQEGLQVFKAGREDLLAKAKEWGLDPLRDIRYAALFAGLDGQNQGKVLTVFGGKLQKSTLEALAKETGARVDGALWVDETGSTVFGQAADGTVLLGSREWVEMALAGKHRNTAFKSLLADYDRKIYFMAAARFTPSIRNRWLEELEPIFRPLFQHLDGVSLSLTYQGSAFKVLTDSAPFVEVYRGILDGYGQLSEASNQIVDGLLNIGEALLASLEPVSGLGGKLAAEEKEILSILVSKRREVRALWRDLLVHKPTKPRLVVNRAAKSVELKLSGGNPISILMLAGAVTALRSGKPTPPTTIGGPVGIIPGEPDLSDGAGNSPQPKAPPTPQPAKK